MEKNYKFTIALIYDFDGTLAAGNMQEYNFIPAIGKSNKEFWSEANDLAEAQDADQILTYMALMIREAQAKGISLRREAFQECGRDVLLYPGVSEWFDRINSYGEQRGVKIVHYINSSGLKEIIEGTDPDAMTDYDVEKIKAGKEGNKGKRTIAKLCLNSLYGKFGQDIQNINKVPYMGEDGSVHYYLSDPKPKKGLYIAVASFITSYARRVTITSAQKIEDDFHAGKSKNRFVYADTDSLHIYSPDDEIPEGLDIDPYRLGAWKLESRFSDYGQKKGYGAKYLRQKCYIENLTEDVDNPNATDYSLKITVAGMPDTCYDQVTFDNFYIGATYFGKNMPKVVDAIAHMTEKGIYPAKF